MVAIGAEQNGFGVMRTYELWAIIGPKMRFQLYFQYQKKTMPIFSTINICGWRENRNILRS